MDFKFTERRPKLADHERTGWEITDHVCRVCFGRVLMRETFDRKRVFRCANCGTENEGRDARVICSCGIAVRGKNCRVHDVGVRCVPNSQVTPENPNEIVAQQMGMGEA